MNTEIIKDFLSSQKYNTVLIDLISQEADLYLKRLNANSKILIDLVEMEQPYTITYRDIEYIYQLARENILNGLSVEYLCKLFQFSNSFKTDDVLIPLSGIAFYRELNNQFIDADQIRIILDMEAEQD